MFFKKQRENSEKEYKKKNYLMSETEWEFFGCLNKLLSPFGYVVQPQVSLVSVIEKLKLFAPYRDELTGIVDFCVFDDDYHPLLLIVVDEENCNGLPGGKSFEKIQNIAEEAGIPLVTFWTNYGANETYIKERLKDYLCI